jgi:hypothetical protein
MNEALRDELIRMDITIRPSEPSSPPDRCSMVTILQ